MLTRLGYDVVVCTRSPDALETFAATPEWFDLVVTDYTMPSRRGRNWSWRVGTSGLTCPSSCTPDGSRSPRPVTTPRRAGWPC